MTETSQVALDWMSLLTQHVSQSWGQTATRILNHLDPAAAKQVTQLLESFQQQTLSAMRQAYQLGMLAHQNPMGKAAEYLAKQPQVRQTTMAVINGDLPVASLTPTAAKLPLLGSSHRSLSV